MRRCLRLGLTFTCLLTLGLAHARGQQPAGQRGSITREAILSRLRTTPPEQRAQGLQALAQAVREAGVDFELTPPVEQELTEAGAGAELLAAIRANYRPNSGAAMQGTATQSAAR